MIEVHVSFGNDAEARGVARDAVEKRLAACANIFAPVRSLYWWNGAIEDEHEVAVVFKTSDEQRDALVAFITGTHSYDTPGIIVHDKVAANEPYAAWVDKETAAR